MRRPLWLGPYRVLDRIASGGMAEIYRAFRETPDGHQHVVAIKKLLPFYTSEQEFVDMLIDEAKITGLLDHPNIARIFEFGLVDESYFMAMEFIDGVDMRSVIRRCREREVELPLEYAVYIVEQALRGLHCAHDQSDDQGRSLEIIHRDFSPSNILISYDGQVKLIDFGIAKANMNRSTTRTGVIKGKVRYMSPEQTWGKRLDRRSDVFAAGVVLYEVASGSPPFHASDDVTLMEAIREQQLEPPSSHNPRARPELDTALGRALAKVPEDRFDTAEGFADALVHYRERFYPRFESAHLGRFMGRIFARERVEAEERFREYDLTVGADDRTPTGRRMHYTRLVDQGRFVTEEHSFEGAEGAEGVEGTAGEAATDADGMLLERVEGWLAARRRSQVPTQPPPEPTTAPAPETDFWSSDSRPGWVDETARTLEMEALRLDEDTGAHEERDTDGGSVEEITARNVPDRPGRG